jgi:hypothetical protein
MTFSPHAERITKGSGTPFSVPIAYASEHTTQQATCQFSVNWLRFGFDIA